jgi:hypothetical protein
MDLLEVLEPGFYQAVELLHPVVGGHIFATDQGQAIGEQGQRIQRYQLWMGKGVKGSGVDKGEVIRRKALPTLEFIPTDLRVD